MTPTGIHTDQVVHPQLDMRGKDRDQEPRVVHTEDLKYHTSTVDEKQSVQSPSPDSTLSFDAATEAKLRWKIDLYIIPTVALLYALCFIDRVNIGMSHSSLQRTTNALTQYRQRKISWARKGPRIERLRLQPRFIYFLHIVRGLRNPFEHGVQMDWPRMVSPRDIHGLWYPHCMFRLRP